MAVDTNGFDVAYYLATNPDVAAAGVDPYQHYLSNGWREGRKPDAIFDTRYYLATNPDVAAAGIDPLAHYLSYGWREGRDPSVAFDTRDYLAVNPDVAAAGVNPMLHYLLYGQGEHRALGTGSYEELSEGFDRAYYLAHNPDVAAAGVDPYLHYASYGNAEGRKPNALFDKAFYLAHNPDVAAAGVDAFQHFLSYGWREGRDPSAGFNLAEYRAVVGTPANVDPLISYITYDRLSGIPRDINETTLPQIVQSRGSPLQAVLVDRAAFAIDGALTHVTAPTSPLDGHDLSGFLYYALTRSTADIAISGAGRLPTSISLGSGDDSLTGVFNLEGQFLNLSAGGGTLLVDAQLDNGSVAIIGGLGGNTVTIHGSSPVYFTGGAGNDIVHLGGGNDSLLGGGGINHLDGGSGVDTADWNAAVRADLFSGQARPVDGSGSFRDTLVGIENLGGSPFDDVLLGDDGANVITGVYFSPSLSGNDIMAGRGGDDTLWGFDGADILIGGRGSDTLIGGEGNDLLIDAADGWGVGGRNPGAYGNEGADTLVYLLGGVGNIAQGNFMDGGSGADTYIVEATATGRWGSLGVQFSQIDGDRLDLSALRTRTAGVVTLDYVRAASSTPFYGSTTIDLAAFHDRSGHSLEGRIVLNGVFSPNDLVAADLVTMPPAPDWRMLVPSDLVSLF